MQGYPCFEIRVEEFRPGLGKHLELLQQGESVNAVAELDFFAPVFRAIEPRHRRKYQAPTHQKPDYVQAALPEPRSLQAPVASGLGDNLKMIGLNSQ